MRNVKMTLAVLSVALIFAGCATSLHPFFAEEESSFNEALLGTWVNDSGDKCTFTPKVENRYELLYTDGTSARFETRLFEVGGTTYLDLYPQPQEKDNGFFIAHFVPAHTLVRVTIGRDSISLAPMDGDRLKKLSDLNHLNLAHERLANGTIVLTAPTRELQAFVVNNAAGEEVFGDAEVYRRIQPE